jgi:hypothetical protein
MRRIIFPNTGPRFVLNAEGFFRQLSTGSDSFCEHNMPENHLNRWVCSRPPIRGRAPTEAEIFESLRITHGELFQFVQLPDNEDGQPEALLGYAKGRDIATPAVLRELRFEKSDIAAALASGHFAIRVRGEALVQALAEFHQAIQAGHVAIAPGSHLDPYYPYGHTEGLVLVNLKTLSDEERTKLTKDVVETLRRRRQVVG